ncbi:MAG: hypothetical protein IJX28_08855 [Clostridia bacterium]|nr:hypothetical protein [Clostridia bacterium]
MKSMAVTLLLLALLLVGVIGNHLYINKVGSEMFRRLDALSAPGDAALAEEVREMTEYWKAQRDRLEITVNFLMVDRVGEQLSILSACVESGDIHGAQTARALLRDAVENILRMEYPSGSGRVGASTQ